MDSQHNPILLVAVHLYFVLGTRLLMLLRQRSFYYVISGFRKD